MIDALAAAVASLAARLRNLEALPFNPYSPDADFFDHFAGDGTIDARWTTTLALTGTVSLPNSAPSYVRLSSGATAASNAQLSWGARYPLVGPTKAVDIRFRARFPTAAGASCDQRFLLADAANVQFLSIGIIGASSTAFFTARTVGTGTTTTVTTVPVNTVWHDWRVQTMPDRIRYYIDNVLVVEHTASLPTAVAWAPWFWSQNGAGAADRQMDVDLVWLRENR